MACAIDQIRGQHPVTKAGEACLVTALMLGIFTTCRKSAALLGVAGLALPTVRLLNSGQQQQPAGNSLEEIVCTVLRDLPPRLDGSAWTFVGYDDAEIVQHLPAIRAEVISYEVDAFLELDSARSLYEEVAVNYQNLRRRMQRIVAISLLDLALGEDPKYALLTAHYYASHRCVVSGEPPLVNVPGARALWDEGVGQQGEACAAMKAEWNRLCDHYQAKFSNDHNGVFVKDEGELNLQEWFTAVQALNA